MWRFVKEAIKGLTINMNTAWDYPIVIILGSTGTGKSKLAIEVAERFNGEIISADSMQVYKGLDIISNKVTPEEQQRVPHHMIDVAEPTENFTVVQFRDSCLDIISDLTGRGKLPVVVGGTNYYIESVLWEVLVGRPQPSEADSADPSAPDSDPGADGGDSTAAADHWDAYRRRLETFSTESLLALLRERDPDQARVLHPNERRKILRALEVQQQTGVAISEHWRRQRQQVGGGRLGGPLRLRRALLLWITAQQQVLDRRLDARVDDMLRRGLLDELADFHARHNAGRPPDYTHGIFQSIGFKEFHTYLTRPASCGDAEAAVLLEEAVDQLKRVTRRYARKQSGWVRRRLLGCGDRQLLPVYRVDASDPARWAETAGGPALQAVAAWLDGGEVPLPPEQLGPPRAADANTVYHCSVCQTFLSGQEQRHQHFGSRRHRKAVAGLARRQARKIAAAQDSDPEHEAPSKAADSGNTDRTSEQEAPSEAANSGNTDRTSELEAPSEAADSGDTDQTSEQEEPSEAADSGNTDRTSEQEAPSEAADSGDTDRTSEQEAPSEAVSGEVAAVDCRINGQS